MDTIVNWTLLNWTELNWTELNWKVTRLFFSNRPLLLLTTQWDSGRCPVTEDTVGKRPRWRFRGVWTGHGICKLSCVPTGTAASMGTSPLMTSAALPASAFQHVNDVMILNPYGILGTGSFGGKRRDRSVWYLYLNTKRFQTLQKVDDCHQNHRHSGGGELRIAE